MGGQASEGGRAMKRPAVMNLDDLMSGNQAAEPPAVEQPAEPALIASVSVEAQTSKFKGVEVSADVEPDEDEDAPVIAPARKPLRKATPETFRTSMYFARSVHDVLREIAYVERKTISDLINEGLDKVLKARGRPNLKELRNKDKA